MRNIEFYKLKNFTRKFNIYCDIFTYVKLGQNLSFCIAFSKMQYFEFQTLENMM
jgi:hypothetical protein